MDGLIVTEDKAIELARYLLKRNSRKPQYVYRIGQNWFVSGNDFETTKLSWERPSIIKDFREVKI